MDLLPLNVAPKILPPPAQQLPNESKRFWSGVTEAIHSRQFARATTLKQDLEEKQREKARRREKEGTEWSPRFFTVGKEKSGRPELTDEGREVLVNLQQGVWELGESKEVAA